MLAMAKAPKKPDKELPPRKPKRLGVPLNVWINPLIRDAITVAVQRSRPRTSVKYIVEVALEEWLKTQGLWPPPDEAVKD